MVLNLDFKHTYKAFGNKTILIEWNSIIDEVILEEILLFKEKIKKEKRNLIIDFIVGYNSLTLIYEKEVLNYFDEVSNLELIYKKDLKFLVKGKFLWEIPVCYDLEFGIDLEEVSSKSKISIEQIINLHSEKTYSVFFIGFLPGFLYLGGLDSKLFFDRRPTPRLNVEKGSVAIGGSQTGVYPSKSAGGWNIIGKTPLIFFDVKKDKPCFANAGDKIKFKPISLEEFYELARNNNFTPSKLLLND